jgi:hypothetical protein
MHLKHARLPIPPRPQEFKSVTPTSSNTYLKLVRLPLSIWALLASVFIPRIEGLRSALSLRSSLPECVVSRVVQTGLPEFGTLLAHIWPKVIKPTHSKI